MIHLFRQYILKYTKKEFWPAQIKLLPVFFYIGYLCIKAKSIFFFSACNPGIPFGWLIGDAKYPVLKQIPGEYAPKTIFVPEWASLKETVIEMGKKGIIYPCIIKPDIWEWWIGVEKLHNKKELQAYIDKYNQDVVIQEYIPGENELTVMYYRYPGHKKWVVDFIAGKEFLSVMGDGKRTLAQLVAQGKRTKFFFRVFAKEHKNNRNMIIKKDEKYVLQFKWNHRQGTLIYDASHFITPELHETFDTIADNIEWFYFWRCDVKYDDINDFLRWKDFKLLDINGVWAEPLHVNDVKYSLLDVWKMRIKHRNIIYRIAKVNHNKGLKYGTLKEFIALKKNFTMQMKKYQ